MGTDILGVGLDHSSCSPESLESEKCPTACTGTQEGKNGEEEEEGHQVSGAGKGCSGPLCTPRRGPGALVLVLSHPQV